jgi:predicted N-acetyltransferase YhbS
MVVQGHPTYYPRFGFERGRTIGILPPEHLGTIDQAWMVRRRPGAPEIRGRIVYPQPFLDLDS